MKEINDFWKQKLLLSSDLSKQHGMTFLGVANGFISRLDKNMTKGGAFENWLYPKCLALLKIFAIISFFLIFSLYFQYFFLNVFLTSFHFCHLYDYDRL